MIYGTDLIHRPRGVTRLHAVAHANTINHGEYELGTRIATRGAIRNRPNVQGKRLQFLSDVASLLYTLIDDSAMTVAAFC